MSEDSKDLVGTNALTAWFGRWPSFHDAEILSVELNRRGTSRIRIHTWNMTTDVNAAGGYKIDKHCVVLFLLEEISYLELADFSGQNVIFGLQIEKQEAEYRLELSPCYGLAGYVVAKSIEIEFEPGIPIENKGRFGS
jgi:hypothetical protein